MKKRKYARERDVYAPARQKREEGRERTASTERLEDLRVDIADADSRAAPARARGHDAPRASSPASVRGGG